MSTMLSDTATTKKKPGWKAMPYILGNETFERFATYGITINLMVYLLGVFHMDQVFAANIVNVWIGLSNFTPVIGAFVADIFLGKFKSIAYASFGTLLGMVMVTLTALVPSFHPPPCNSQQQEHGKCIKHTNAQFGFLFGALCLLAIGTGGIRPCSVPFSIEQFDQTTAEGRKGISSFYNWFYTSFTLVLLMNQTLVVYIQSNISWALGFALPTFFMICAIILFFSGKNVYVHVQGDGNASLDIAQVFVAAYKKRHLQLPVNEEEGAIFYDPTLKGVEEKACLTRELRFLNKAALLEEKQMEENDLNKNPWRLCSIQQVEGVKCLMQMIPICVSGIISFIPITQQGTFPISQALTMDRFLGSKFEMPAGSITVISLITVAIWLPLYDRVLQPALAKFTKQEEGLTSLQKITIGNIFAILSMVVSGLMERYRRASALSGVTISVMWLAPQFVAVGLCDLFNIVGHTEFYNKECPVNMRIVSNSLLYLVLALSGYVSSLVLTVVHKVTGKHGRADWMNNDLNAGRLDYFYFLLAGLAALNFVYFMICAHRYRYKTTVKA
ncbi:NRT1/PTR family protein 2.2 [Quillaja saponaria]|uniref:NRT1/PTR family protein 2.2 n=1 Tax=Quillaja saponaria TaxID=32244 RepID=A0AAD7KPB8_QUISA|nr:NRT1/PTR family protein 2.2 [Quillaja saponaria]